MSHSRAHWPGPTSIPTRSARPAAQAHSEAIVLVPLLYFGVAGGLLSATAVVLLKREQLSFAWPFAISLAFLALAAGVWARSIEIIPYAIGFGAFASVLPFVLSYYGGRFLALRASKFLGSRWRRSAGS